MLRGLRFAAVGGGCGIVRLALLIALSGFGLNTAVAIVGAYLLSARLNFLLSYRFIWGDRGLQRTAPTLARRWGAVHRSFAGTFLLSRAVFIATRVLLPVVAASAVGIGVAALANFSIQDRLTFRTGRT